MTSTRAVATAERRARPTSGQASMARSRSSTTLPSARSMPSRTCPRALERSAPIDRWTGPVSTPRGVPIEHDLAETGQPGVCAQRQQPQPNGRPVGRRRGQARPQRDLEHVERDADDAHHASPGSARPRANSAEKTSDSRAVPASTALSRRGSPPARTTRSSGSASGALSSGSSAGRAGPDEHEHGRRQVGEREEQAVLRHGAPLAEPHRQRQLAGPSVLLDVAQVVDDEDGRDERAHRHRRRQCQRLQRERLEVGGAGHGHQARRRRRRRPRPGRGSRRARARPCRRRR